MTGVLQGRISAVRVPRAVELSEEDQLLLAIAMCPEGEEMYLHQEDCLLSATNDCTCDPEVYVGPRRGSA